MNLLITMKKRYVPKEIEKPLYKFWEKEGFFTPKNKSVVNFSMILPPPNITGKLHMGHAFQQTIMDTIIRYQRMLGKNTLWKVGTDHAGIATQIIIEGKIKKETGKTLKNYNKKEFFKKIWDWKDKSIQNINNQIRRLGSSVDWTCERFSLDDGFSEAVKKVFITLYENKIIYRRKKLVNWDSKLCTAISDIEVVNRNENGKIWYIRYPFFNDTLNKKYLIVATTRPETILGDTAIAINPNDRRYKSLIGKYVIVPIVNRIIPIIFDKYIDINKETGCMKVTPAHDFNDYKIGLRHKLPMINFLTLNGKIRKNLQIYDTNGNISKFYNSNIPNELQKIDRFIARNKIINILIKKKLLENIKNYNYNVPYNERSNTIIEPLLTTQWFIKTKLISKNAIKAVEEGKIQFFPKKYEKLYFSWMKNIEDWCISRQLWWGHRIPAWYDINKNVYVGNNEIEIRLKYNLPSEIQLKQDKDVLDTWFSSSLWTFVSLGWPKNTNELKFFHPTDLLVTGFDIIFFWVARMIMLTMYFIKDKNNNSQIPFKHVFITGLIRDEKGKKMSKSKGNVIDPLDIIDGISLDQLLKKRTKNMIHLNSEKIIEKNTKIQFPQGIQSYGTDALRFTLLALASNTYNINWNINRLYGYRNFCNKLWNASRFIFFNIESKDYGQKGGKIVMSLFDSWIISELNKTIKLWKNSIENYRFDIATNILYSFIWGEFCNWYLEISKANFKIKNIILSRSTRYFLIEILEIILRLAHPTIPFITEEIWKKIKIFKNIHDKTIMLQKFPQYDKNQINFNSLKNMIFFKKFVSSIRNIRKNMNILQKVPLFIFFNSITKSKLKILIYCRSTIKNLINIYFVDKNFFQKNQLKIFTKVIDLETEITVFFKNISNFNNSKFNQISLQIEKINKQISNLKLNLENKNFLLKAPKKIIQKKNEKIKELQKIKTNLLKQNIIVSN